MEKKVLLFRCHRMNDLIRPALYGAFHKTLPARIVKKL